MIFPKKSFKFYLNLLFVITSQSLYPNIVTISEKRVDELANWFASGMQEAEKLHKKKAAQQKTSDLNSYTQTEASMKLLIDNYNSYLKEHNKIFSKYFDKSKDAYPIPPTIVTLNDLRNNEDKIISWILEIYKTKTDVNTSSKERLIIEKTLPKCIPLIKNLLKKERENSNDYVFYHGHSFEAGLTFDLYREVENFLYYSPTIFSSENITDFKPKESIFRFLKNINTKYKNANELVNAWQESWDDEQTNLSDLLLSTNFALFQNSSLISHGENTFFYFLKSISAYVQNQSNKWIDEIFKHWNFDPKYKKDLQQLYTNFMHSENGNLLQIFIPRELVNKYVYISVGRGNPVVKFEFKERTYPRDSDGQMHLKIIKTKATDDYKKFLNIDNFKPLNILDFYRKTNFSNFNERALELIDILQARILLIPSFFDLGNNIKIFKYTTSEIEGEFGYDYKKGLRIIVAKMILNYVIKNQTTIKGGNDKALKKILDTISEWSEEKYNKEKMDRTAKEVPKKEKGPIGKDQAEKKSKLKNEDEFNNVYKRLLYHVRVINSYHTAIAQSKQNQIKQLKPKIEQIKKVLLTLPINIKNNKGQTALMVNPAIAPIVYAVDKRRASYIVNAKDKNGKNVLQYLIESPLVDKIYIYQALKHANLTVSAKELNAIQNKLKSNPIKLKKINEILKS